jgi:hypothetical protein
MNLLSSESKVMARAVSLAIGEFFGAESRSFLLARV